METSEDRAREGAALSGAARERYVAKLFDRVASPYDRLNRILSLGRDQVWRRRAVALAEVRRGGRVCDLGTGTGDLALAFAEAVGVGGGVLGVDLARGMLERARAKETAGGARVHWVLGNAAAVPVASGSADAVGMGWSLRNVGDRAAVYREVSRILRPGGRLVVVDMSRPRGVFARLGFWAFRHVAMPALVALFRGDREAYRYLARSTDRFPDAAALAGELEGAGFVEVRVHPRMLGAVAIHVARRPEGGPTPP